MEATKCPVCDWDIKDGGREVLGAVVCCDDCAGEMDRAAIRAHVDGLFRAFIGKDRDAIRRGHTTDWRGFQVKSTRLCRGIEEYMSAAEVALATFRGTRYEILEMEIQLHGALAVVYYTARYWVDDGGGERFITLRSADIYRREAQGWNQCGSNICFLENFHEN